MFRKILIANRGEIAVRIIRSARALGVRSVVVYSDADATAPHVWLADEAHAIGRAPAAESYLNAQAILKTGRRAGVDAIHPGYGFLSEDPAFARLVQDSGFVFVGPSPQTLAAVGEKTAARRLMRDAGVPVVPGSEGVVRSAREAIEVAQQTGLPILLKPAGGGGGKGMRLVRELARLDAEFAAAAREAEKAFGNPDLYVERHLGRVRHLEVQILGTEHGVLTLGERECSIQRRHQKLFEETPSPATEPQPGLRKRLLEAALRAGKAVDYRNAGTVEFLLDEEGGIHFIEINARLQVEHPVTELVTGLDLVEAQLRIAAGDSLPDSFREIRPSGWAIECRICAEDAERDFLPATGVVRGLRVPGGPGVRWDGGIQEGTTVGPHYDSLLGKIAAWGEDRSQAIARLEGALDELRIDGLTTNLGFLRRVTRDEHFLAGQLHTGFIQERRQFLGAAYPPDLEAVAAAVVAQLTRGSGRSPGQAPGQMHGHAQANGAAPQSRSAWRSEPLPFVWIP
jgi:acetyl/propionyl-CoA carboxylase alpha subunit